MSLPDPPVLLVTDRRQAARPLDEIVAAACAAGCRWISLREKDLPRLEQIELAQRLLSVARMHGARLSVHGDATIAQAAGSEGVHLPAGSDVSVARDLLGDDALIGLSIHDAADLAHATAADYVVAGPVFETASKPGYGPALGPDGLAALACVAPVPVLAIGGIAAGNVAACLRAGAAGIAVMGGIMRANDAGTEMRALLRAVSHTTS